MMTSITRVSMSMVLLFSGISVDRSQAQEISEIKSPRLRALAVQLDGGNGRAVGRFWREMEAETTPLVEAIGTRRCPHSGATLYTS